MSIKYKKRKKEIDENNGKVPRKSEKMPKYLPNLHYIMPNLLHLHIDVDKWLIMCAKTINYFFIINV